MVTETAGSSAAPAAGWGRWAKMLLIASLALNVLICGALIGFALTGKHRHGAGAYSTSSRGEIGIKSFIRQLPPERRKVLDKILKQEKGDLGPLKSAVVTARVGAAAALSADPFDAGAARRAFGAIDEADAKLRTTAREAIMKTVEGMTPDERRELTRWWQQKKAYLFRVREPREKRREKAGRPEDAGGGQPAPAPSQP